MALAVNKPTTSAEFIILAYTMGLSSALGHRDFDIHVAYSVVKYGFRVEVKLRKTDALGKRMAASAFIVDARMEEARMEEAFYSAKLVPPPEMVAALMLMDS